MTKHAAPEPEGADETPVEPVKRLCNEIQLFDLCDRERCGFKEGAYCTDPELLRRFESIADEDERTSVARSNAADDDDEWEGDDELDDSYDDERCEHDGYDDE